MVRAPLQTMRNLARTLLLLGLGLLVLPASAGAADPIMPLSDVREGMRCEGRSVIRGTDIARFDVEIQDVVEDEANPGSQVILFRASGPAVDATGVGEGFSGSPILCPGADGGLRTAGAISYGIGEYGNKVGLATPIESMLAEPADPPRGTTRDGRRAGDSGALRSPRASRLPGGARPLGGPLTVTGLGPRVFGTLARAARRARRSVFAAPPAPLRAFPPQPLRPGASLATGLATGDLAVGAVGTATYVDGARVWGFGHPLDSAGARSLFLQDAYVYSVVNNPDGEGGGSYKLAAPGHVVGELRNDAPNAVVGRLGAMPDRVALTVRATDLDAGRSISSDVDLADETAVDQPLGVSPASLVAPLAVAQTGLTALRGAPARLSGSMCARITLRDVREPLRFCKSHVATGTASPDEISGVPATMAGEIATALELVDGYTFGRVQATAIEADVKLRRGLAQALILDASAPRRAIPGRRLRVVVSARRVRGSAERLTLSVRVPRSLRPGRHRLVLTGPPGDDDEVLEETLGGALGEPGGTEEPEGIEGEGDPAEPGPASIEELRTAVAALGRRDDLRARFTGAGGGSVRIAPQPAAGMRLSGRAEVVVTVPRGDRRR